MKGLFSNCYQITIGCNDIISSKYGRLNINLTTEERNQVFVERDGAIYLILGNGKSFFNSIHYDENWQPPFE